MNTIVQFILVYISRALQPRIWEAILGKAPDSVRDFLINFPVVLENSLLGVVVKWANLLSVTLPPKVQLWHAICQLLATTICWFCFMCCLGMFVSGIVFLLLERGPFKRPVDVSKPASGLGLVGLGLSDSKLVEPQLVELGDDLVSFFFSTYGFNPDYTTISYFILISALIASVLLILPLVLKPSTPSFEKNSSYECGFEPFVCKNESFESHFLIVGVLFLLFDLELIFLFPLVAIPTTVDLLVLVAVIPFLVILFFGFLFEWVRGALLWPIFYSKRENIF